MSYDPHANFAISSVAVAPSPASSGTTLSISNADAALFPDADVDGAFNAVVWPASEQPTTSNAEIVRVTAVGAADSGGSGNTQLTITRTQESTNARSIQAGDKIALSVTAKLFTDIEEAVADLNTGWIADTDTWTYASATTFTIAGKDVTGRFPKGAKLKLTQTSAKYFYVVSSSFSTDTTVTVTGGSDYSLANAAITSPYYSYQATPQGFPTFFAYTPTWASSGTQPSLVNGSAVGRFTMNGNLVTAYISFQTGASTTYGTGSYSWALPVTAKTVASPTEHRWVNILRIRDAGTATYVGYTVILSSATTFTGVTMSGTTENAVSATSPMTWASTDNFEATITFEC